MAMVNMTKEKVWPLLDFCELNKYVECYTWSEVIDVCDEKVETIGSRNCNSEPYVCLHVVTYSKETMAGVL